MQSTPHVLYLVHDLSDPAVRRRVTMFRAGGASVTLAGFRRDKAVVPGLAAPAPIELGRTADGRFTQRLAAVAKAGLSLGSRLKGVPKPDVIVARNLEMLALAKRANALFAGEVPVAYECLDIHRLLLGEGMISRAMRAAERSLGRDAALLMTSSPAFMREYFHRFGQIDAPAMLLENKVLELDAASGPHERASASAAGEPWVIGWFGALRCRKSLALLAAFARSMDGRFEIVLRGRPAYSEFADFDGFVDGEPHMRFEGAYRNPEDLSAIYGEVHFTWAIDFFEEGLNSAWLLPNRLYEGCRHGAVPIAMRATETGRFLAERGLGVLLDDAGQLTASLEGLTSEGHAAARAKILAEDRSTWIADLGDCRALVDRLKTLAAAAPAGEVMLQAA
jgi:succinoglycan biosynthesis protein ExoL